MPGFRNSRDNRGSGRWGDNKGGSGGRQRDRGYDRDGRSQGSGNQMPVMMNPWQSGITPGAGFQQMQASQLMMNPQMMQRGGYGGQMGRMGGMGMNMLPMVGGSNFAMGGGYMSQQHLDRQSRDDRSRGFSSRNRSDRDNSQSKGAKTSAYYGKPGGDRRDERDRRGFDNRDFSRSHQRSRDRDFKQRSRRQDGDKRRGSPSPSSSKRARDEKDSSEDRRDRKKLKGEDEDDDKEMDKNKMEGGLEDKEEAQEKSEEESAEQVGGQTEDGTKVEKEEESENKPEVKEAEDEQPKKRPEDDFDCELLFCHICDLSDFATKRGFIRHLQGMTHEKMAEAFHAKNAAQLELLNATVKVLEMRQRDKYRRDTGERLVKVKKTMEHHLIDKMLKPTFCCNKKLDSPFALEEHKLSIIHLERMGVKHPSQKGKSLEEVDVTLAADPEFDSMIEEAKQSAELCPFDVEDPPVYDSSEAFGLEFMVKRTRYWCKACRSETSPQLAGPHCHSTQHYENVLNYFRKRAERKRAEEEEAQKKREEEERAKEEANKEVDLEKVEKTVLEVLEEENEDEADDNAAREEKTGDGPDELEHMDDDHYDISRYDEEEQEDGGQNSDDDRVRHTEEDRENQGDDYEDDYDAERQEEGASEQLDWNVLAEGEEEREEPVNGQDREDEADAEDNLGELDQSMNDEEEEDPEDEEEEDDEPESKPRGRRGRSLNVSKAKPAPAARSRTRRGRKSSK